MASAITREQFPLIKALERTKRANPEQWKQLIAELRARLGTEAAILVRAPVDLLQVAQGRAQVAEDVLKWFERCSEMAEEVERVEAPPTAPHFR